MAKKSLSILFAVLLFGASGGCYESTSSPWDGEDLDGPIDDWRMDDIRFDDPARPEYPPYDGEILYDPYPVDPPPPDIPPGCTPECSTVPMSGEIGAPCVSSATCDYGATCITQVDYAYEGWIYTSFYQGACILYGAGSLGCDPEVPTTCPTGSTCMYLFDTMGQEYYGCLDTCTAADTAGNPYDYNCGCRAGYQCDLNLGVCLPGCSNDRQCCEQWCNLYGTDICEPGDLVVKEGCTNTCDDGGLFSGGSPTICTATFACINNGDPSNRWGGPCEGDAWCPPDGRCYDEFRYSEDPADPAFPGGYCVKDACNYIGRGCSDYGGACASLGDSRSLSYECVGTCHFGRIINDADYECRKTLGQEQACIPVDPSFWYVPPMDGSDGYCWPGNFHPDGGSLGDACIQDEDCESGEYGLGTCLELPGIYMSPFCSLFCSETAAVNFAVCGGDDGTGHAAGACWSGYCWEACTDLTAPLGSNGCSQPSAMACYPTAVFGSSVKVGSSLSVPPGICIPACTNDEWCSLMWGITVTCNRTTGVCE